MRVTNKNWIGAAAAAAFILGTGVPVDAKVGFGKPGEKVDLVIGYQPYYTESWSGVVINGKNLWKKHLPKGSSAKFEIGLQGSVIVGKLLGEKNHIGYMGDMPAIVSSMRESQSRSAYDICARYIKAAVQYFLGSKQRAEVQNGYGSEVDGW